MEAESLYIFLSLRRIKAGVLVMWNLAAREGDAVVSTEAERILEFSRWFAAVRKEGRCAVH